MKKLKSKLENLGIQELSVNEYKNVNGGQYYYGRDSVGNFVWWYNEDGNREGYYLSYSA